MRFTTLNEWLSWQESLHPVEIDLGLDRVASVWQRMSRGTSAFTVVSVSGTNGKGSCVAMLDAIYRAAGYKVGTYTSPHIKRYNERISINGKPVSDVELCNAFDLVDRSRGEISLTYFEFGTLAAFNIFQQSSLDLVILEVGLGGRLDAVNVWDADVAVISGIDLDHQDWLGNTRELIALEKAGIARSGHPTVCGDSNPPFTLIEYINQIDSPLLLVNRDFQYCKTSEHSWSWQNGSHRLPELPVPRLRGDFQLNNAATVLMTVSLLEKTHPVTQADIRQGLMSAFVAGRFQVVPGDVTVVLDVAHNVQGTQALAQTLTQWPCSGLTLAVFGVLKDKDVIGMINAIKDIVDQWFVADLVSPRAMSSQQIESLLRNLGVTQAIHRFDSIKLAKESAVEHAGHQDRVVAFGSFFVVSELL